MKISLVSDTHGRHKLIEKDLNGGDVLIHCGDISERGYEYEVNQFLQWLSKLDYTHKIFIAGNHDFFFENNYNNVQTLVNAFNKLPEANGKIVYLENESIEIDGLKFFGTPWQPWFYDWAFNLPRGGEQLKKEYDKIPDDTDVLISHSPPHKMLDITQRNDRAGSQLLLDRILEVNPILNCFGHIHEAYGQKTFHGIQFVNCSVVNARYIVANKPIDIEINDGKVLYL